MKQQRPLSPHIQIYRMMFTMLMSMAHRVSGMALYLGSVVFILFLVTLACSEGAFLALQGVLASLPAKIVLFLFSWALLHHALGGVRHFIWDFGRGFGLVSIEWFARLTLILSTLGNILLWVVVS
ncbi:MAG: succinate dehydrogenase, cytochrome b556 subunit [Parvibaculales bacterium]